MLIQQFRGIDNVNPPEQLAPAKGRTALAEAMNVDLGNAGQLRRRAGYAQASEVCHKNLWPMPDGMLATVDGGDLVYIDADGNETILYESLGTARVWYGNWPDGTVSFSNGAINGIVLPDGSACRTWGIPVPEHTGAAAAIGGGQLFEGGYRVAITYVRLADGLEGGPAYSTELAVGANGGISLTGLPTLAGHKINVYLTSHNGQVPRFAGSTTGDTYSFTGPNKQLIRECQTEHCERAPVGTLSAYWRGRALHAQDGVLWASKPLRPHHFDLSEDFKPFSAPITLLQPVEAGIFVGTTRELAFLRGTNWRELTYTRVFASPVARGSGVTVPGEHLKRAQGTAGSGDCVVGICGGHLFAGYPDGAAALLTQNVYQTGASEYAATFRVLDGGIPQYLAIAQ